MSGSPHAPRRHLADDWELDSSPGLPGDEPQPRRRRPRPEAGGGGGGAAAAARIERDGEDDDEEAADSGDDYDDADGDDGADGGDEAAEARDTDAERASGDELRTLTQQMLCIDLPPLVEVESPAALSAFEFTPLAPGTRWLRLADVGVVLAVPRSWRLLRGAGHLLGVPVVQYVAASAAAATGDGGDGASISVRHFRGAFASALLAAARGSPHGVARFFAQLHVIRASPPGLVSAAQFADAGSGGGDSAAFDNVGAVLGGGGADGGAPADGAAALRGLVGHADPARRPDVVGSWHRSITRSEVMDLPDLVAREDAAAAASAHVDGGGPRPTPPGERRRLLQPRPDGAVIMHVPVALGPGALLQRTAVAAYPRPPPASWPTPSIAPTPPPPPSSGPTRAVELRATDRLEVYGLEYAMRHAPGGPADAATAGGGVRYNVTLVLDPAADSVHEVAFACAADAWDAAWAHETPRGGGGAARLRALGLESVSAMQLLDAATVVGVVPAAPQPEHEIG